MRRFYLLFLFVFSIAASRAQSITVTAPNGGEVLYACQTYNITWTASGTSNYYDIDYSLNNGAVWASIASNLNVTNGQYVWTVPNVESNICLVRVRDKNNNSTADVSNAVFTIHIPVLLTSPNGGESWVGNSLHPITWNIQGTSNTFNLDYSTNNGSTWTSIATNLSNSTGIYNWTVPNIPSTSCLVRVRDAVTNCMQDVSNGTFTISPAQPILTSPNGGNNYIAGNQTTITWNQATYYDQLRLEYSTDNGLTWTVITTSTGNTGTFNWNIPSTINSTTCLIKASQTANVNIFDVSDALFAIRQPSVRLTAPNGGEAFTTCGTYPINFQVTGMPVGLSGSLFYLYSSKDNGSTWDYITYVNATSTSVYSYNWTVPNDFVGTQCLVRIFNNTFTSMTDTSDAPFTVVASNAITVTSPNGGEIYPALGSTTITWTNTAQASGLYNVTVYNGTLTTTLASGISGNSFTWNNIPNVPGSAYYVRVIDANNTCKYDQSNATFTVTPAQPLLTAPNGTVNYTAGNSMNITWMSSTFNSNVRLEYSTDNGLTWNVITSATTNSGSYSWSIPSSINSATCLVKASNTSNLNSNDVSDAVFAIRPPAVRITAPNGGESFTTCETYPINFQVVGVPSGLSGSYFYLYGSKDNGSTWDYITNVVATSGSIYSYNWTVPSEFSGSQCLIRIYNSTFNTMTDTTDAAFTVVPNNAIKVTSPNGGEIYPALSSTTITWTNTASASGLYNVTYYNGSTTTTLASGISGNSYTWNNIPNVPGSAYYVRVTDANNTCKRDQSDATFSVTPAQPLLTAPNGTVNYTAGNSMNITWLQSTFNSNVRLEYSTDNGLTWNVITTATTNNGSYSWSIPSSINSATCLVKASNTSNLNSNDVSDAVFAIRPPAVRITSPNGGESFTTCETYPINFQVVGVPSGLSGSYFYLYGSKDNGSTWDYITNVVATSGSIYSYNWTVPSDFVGTQCLLRIYNSTFGTMTDTSDASFTVVPNNAITVTSPNGGEVYPALTGTTITWTNTASASGLYNVTYYNGTSTTTLASGISGNSFTWNSIPNVPGSAYYVRVTDANNTCKRDQSDATFTVSGTQPLLLSPNGGVNYTAGNSMTISWLSTTFNSNVRLEYSTDNGLTWNVITSATTNSGSYSWSIPSSINSATCLVKASNTNNLNSNDVSDAVFAIRPPAVRITSPNGGESFTTCETYPINFQVVGVPSGLSGSYFYLYGSKDNGSTWDYITNVVATSGSIYSYNWTVPSEFSGSQCLIRIYNSTFNTMTDTTDAAFTVVPNNAIKVTSPNGGEIFPALSSTTITWTNTASASGLYNVTYYNGSTTTTLASGISGNSYTWNNIPNVPGSAYYVRVTDANNTCKYDQSDANFTVSPAQPVLYSPNGGERYTWNRSVSIVWLQSTFNSNVRLEYSTDNGLTWNVITTATSNTGVYVWTVPAITSSTCLIKASNTNNLNSNDVSDATFSIVPPSLTLTSPNGGESWFGCETYNITFTVADIPTGLSGTTFNLYRSVNNGGSWIGIGSVTATSATSYTFPWTVTGSISSPECKIRVVNTSYTMMADTSNAMFNIQPSNAITVTTPNGGEVIPALSTKLISWTNTASASGLYNVYYYNGTTTLTLATGITGNNFNWTNIPNVPGTGYRINVFDANNTCKYDVSDADFTVSAAQPVLTGPNGGGIYASGNTTNIVWNAATFYSPVRLEYSIDNGTTWILITASTSNSGSYSWTLPNESSTNCLVKATNTADLNSFDVSDAVFTILPAVTIYTPNGGDELGACTQTSISFRHSSTYTSFTIQYSINGGINWSTIASSQTFTGSTGTYNWTIPNLPTSNAMVRVYPTNYTAFADQSDSAFAIKAAVTLIQPNFGGTMAIGSVLPIKWKSEGISNLYDLAYSTTGAGGPWTNIVIGYNTSTDTYNWTVPNLPSTDCYMRIRDNVSSCKEDISNFPFTIGAAAQPIMVTSSNGGETVQGCQNYTIRWTESGAPIGSYKLDYSINGGTSWTNIVTNYATTAGTYNWIIPNNNTEFALVRVSSAANANIFDVSDAAFTIAARSIKALPDTILCTSGNVQLRATGGLGTFNWSPATGLNNAFIANPMATVSGSINYIISSSNGTCVITDTATITVAKPIQVTVTSTTPAVCAGQVARFAARVSEATAASFQWKKNGAVVGSNDSTLVLSSILTSDIITCTVTSVGPCVTTATSSNLSVSAYTALGADTIIVLNCSTCTTNLNALYNGNGYAQSTWNTLTPATASPGLYRLIANSGNGCRDTAIVNVNLVEPNVVRTCASGAATISAGVSGSTYSWQYTSGSGVWFDVSSSNYSGQNTATLQIMSASGAYSGYQYRCLVNGTTFTPVTTLKITAYWTGDVSTDWNTPGNWACGAVPLTYTDVFIYGGKTNYPVVSTSGSCKSIYAAPGTTVTVMSGAAITVSGR